MWVENCRQFGGPWLALELIRRLGLDEFLEGVMPHGQETVPWSVSALLLVVARLCKPFSELDIAEQWYAKTALPELWGVPARSVEDNRPYRALDQLLPHKDKLEAFLKSRLGELFELEYDLLLYDITSTYFEGQANFELAQRGYSRDKRSDSGQVCLGLVVSRCGMPIGYEVFAGNTADVTTVDPIVETMERRYGKRERIWVMDRGMVSEENIAARPAWATNPAACWTSSRRSARWTSCCPPARAWTSAAAASPNRPITKPSSCNTSA